MNDTPNFICKACNSMLSFNSDTTKTDLGSMTVYYIEPCHKCIIHAAEEILELHFEEITNVKDSNGKR